MKGLIAVANRQLTSSEKCQRRKARSQRNHLACCYHAWVSLKVHAKMACKKRIIYRLFDSPINDTNYKSDLTSSEIPI